MAKKKKIGERQVRIAAEKEDQFLFESVDNNQARMTKAIRNLEKKMLSSLRMIETDKTGRIEAAKVNLKQTRAIHRQMLKDFEEIYGSEVRSMVSGFEDVDQFISNTWKYLGEAESFTGVEKDMQRSLKKITQEQYRQFGDDAVRKIDDAMYQHMVGGKSYGSLVAAVTGVLTGHESVTGTPMSRYARQFAFDSTMNYHNQVNLQKAEGLGIYHYLYVGDIIASSRKFCRRRAGKVYTRGQINSWDRFPWQGRSGPAFTHRGGYNCRHHWRPVRPEWLKGKKQVDIADWRVGPSAIQAKPKHLTKVAGTRGWNEYTKEERKLLTDLQRRIKSGRPVTDRQKYSKYFMNGLNQAERDAFITAFEKEGLEVPKVLRKGSVKPTPPKPQPTPKPTPKPKPKPPTPKPPTPKPGPVTPGREWKDFDSKEKQKLRGIRTKLVKGIDVKPNTARIKWWNTLPREDRDNIIKMWQSEGLVVPEVLRGGTTLPTITPTKKITPTKPKPPKKAKITGSARQLKKQLKEMEKNAWDMSIPYAERYAAQKQLPDVRIAYSKVCSHKEYVRLKKEAIKDYFYDTPDANAKAFRTFYKGTRHMSYEALEDLRASGMRVLQGGYGRASFAPNTSTMELFHRGSRGSTTVAHEIAHAMDFRMAEGSRGFKGNRLMWSDKNNPWASKKDSRKMMSYYDKQKSGKTGYYSNGDGAYDIGDWIDDYEGRRYGSGNALQFWSMGNERYYDAFDIAAEGLLRNLTRSVDEFQSFIGHAKTSPYYKRSVKSIQNVSRLITGEITPEEYLERVLKRGHGHGFAAQMTYYPEYADYIMKYYKNMRKSRPLEIEDLLGRKKITPEMIKEHEEILKVDTSDL